MKKYILVIVVLVLIIIIQVSILEAIVNKSGIEIGEIENNYYHSNQENLDYLSGLGFKSLFFNSFDEYQSDQFDDVYMYADSQSITGYQSRGYRVDGIVVSSSFYISADGVEYRFEFFPEQVSETDNGDTYILIVNREIDDSNRGFLKNRELINKCNQFITQVQPIVEHQYTLEENHFDSGLVFPDVANYQPVKQVGEFTLMEPLTDDVMSRLTQVYTKDNYLITINDEAYELFLFDDDQNLIGKLSRDHQGLEYWMLLNDDNQNYQEVYGQDENFEFSYLDAQASEIINQHISDLNQEYQAVQEQLI